MNGGHRLQISMNSVQVCALSENTTTERRKERYVIVLYISRDTSVL